MDNQLAKLHAIVSAMQGGHQAEPLQLDGFAGEALALAQSIESLREKLNEAQAYASALAQGDLSYAPRGGNPFSPPLKSLHATLNHLTWQAQQVADGYLNQRNYFLDEITRAFQSVALDLTGTKEETVRIRSEGLTPESLSPKENNGLLSLLINALNLGLVIVDASTRALLFLNDRGAEILSGSGIPNDESAQAESIADALFAYEGKENGPHRWEISPKWDSLHYLVESRLLAWEGRHVYAHIIEDVTNKTAQASALIQRLYRDDMTGLYNRRYCLEQMSDFIARGTMFTLCYFDFDNLKYVNDKYLHSEGDAYINLVVDTIKQFIRNEDIFGRLGGDEFCVIFRNTPARVVENKFAMIAKDFKEKSYRVKPYSISVSYGIMEISGGRESIQDIIRQVDEKMYAYKRANKPMPKGESSAQA